MDNEYKKRGYRSMIGIIERLISAEVCGAILLLFIIIFIIKNSKFAKITKDKLEACTIFFSLH